MANPNGGRGRKPSQPVPPKLPDGNIDKEKVRQLFLASGHVEWKPFCEGYGWDVIQSYHTFPVKEWTAEKKHILASRQAEEISNQLFSYKSGWHKEVLKTLKIYPSANDAMLAIIQTRQNQMIGMIERDKQKMTLHQETVAKVPHVEHPLPQFEFSTVKSSEIFQLALALKTVTSSKYGSLLLNRWSVKDAEDFSTPQGALENSDAGQAREDRDWTLQLTGGENITKKEMEGFMQTFLDPPTRQIEMSPTPPEEPAQPVASDILDQHNAPD